MHWTFDEYEDQPEWFLAELLNKWQLEGAKQEQENNKSKSK